VTFFVAGLFNSFFSAPFMIIGGLLGWMAGAGPRSFGFALFFALALPFILYFVIFVILQPYVGLVTSVPLRGGDSSNFSTMLFGSFVGSIAALLLLFFPMSKARKGWRQHKILLETVS
jgi:hypothetical protein